MPAMLRASLLLVLLIGIVGCTTDDTPTSPDNGGGVPADPSFSQDVQPIFDNEGCTASQCHGQAQSGGLDLRAGASRDALVNVNSPLEPNFLRVAPFLADSSYLIIKLEDNQGAGSAMPLGGSPLDSVDIQTIRNWIDQGAKNN
jgi:hypothetical protein